MSVDTTPNVTTYSYEYENNLSTEKSNCQIKVILLFSTINTYFQA